VLLSEAPIGAAPEPWRFPPRNRILAALAEVVIVVESHPKGGSRYTVDAAIARGVPVMAVPGSVRASASSLPNQLLSEGCAPVRDALDVLVALGLGRAGGSRTEGRPAPRPGDAAVLAALGWEPVSLETAVLRVGIDVAAVSVALARLEDAGWVRDLGGRWERCASPP
jgi:DNA processing protein